MTHTIFSNGPFPIHLVWKISSQVNLLEFIRNWIHHISDTKLSRIVDFLKENIAVRLTFQYSGTESRLSGIFRSLIHRSWYDQWRTCWISFGRMTGLAVSDYWSNSSYVPLFCLYLIFRVLTPVTVVHYGGPGSCVV